VNNELEGMWKEDIMARFKVFFQHLGEGIYEINKKPQDKDYYLLGCGPTWSGREYDLLGCNVM
jgi:hypothetical protein